MTPVLINRCKNERLPRTFLASWLKKIAKQKPFIKIKQELVIVFVDKNEMKKLNKQYRGRNYATDVLSFESGEPDVLGELVICPQVLKIQAKDTGLSYQHELGYMVLHGALHLLGYDHERSKAEEKKMFALQDRIFYQITGLN
jgi:probable rRNA maturation factor